VCIFVSRVDPKDVIREQAVDVFINEGTPVSPRLKLLLTEGKLCMPKKRFHVGATKKKKIVCKSKSKHPSKNPSRRISNQKKRLKGRRGRKP
jgi:hypothetical protein